MQVRQRNTHIQPLDRWPAYPRRVAVANLTRPWRHGTQYASDGVLPDFAQQEFDDLPVSYFAERNTEAIKRWAVQHLDLSAVA